MRARRFCAREIAPDSRRACKTGTDFQNRSQKAAALLEVGSRNPVDETAYSDIDLHATERGYTRKDGTPYPAR